MGAVYDALLEVSPDRDGELLGGYRVYESALEAILTPEQLVTFVKYIRDSKTVSVFDEMTPDQIAALPRSKSLLRVLFWRRKLPHGESPCRFAVASAWSARHCTRC